MGHKPSTLSLIVLGLVIASVSWQALLCLPIAFACALVVRLAIR